MRFIFKQYIKLTDLLSALAPVTAVSFTNTTCLGVW